jgi:hypothetical protein
MGQYNNDNKTTITYDDSTYTGDVIVKDGKQIRDGYGTQQWNDDKSYYEGEWTNDKRHGKGTYVMYEHSGVAGTDQYELKWEYEGEWQNNKKNGEGTQRYFDDKKLTRYTGSWKDDKFNGRGKLFFKDGSMYQGRFKDGQAYTNQYETAKLIFEDGSYINSEWLEGKPWINGDPDFTTGKDIYFDKDDNKKAWDKRNENKGYFAYLKNIFIDQAELPTIESSGGKRKFTMKRKKHTTRKYKSKHNRKTKQAKYKQTKKYTSNM